MTSVALLSVYDKDGILEFARGLRTLGWRLLASNGTSKVLKSEGVTCTNLSEVVGAPVLDHRVVTLHPAIHGGLMAEQRHARELKTLGWRRIDLLVINLYPLEIESGKRSSTAETVIEKTDVGGPGLLRSAAKGRRLIVTDPNSYGSFLRWLSAGLPEEHAVREHMAIQAERLVAKYCTTSAKGIARFAPGEPKTEEGWLWPACTAH